MDYTAAEKYILDKLKNELPANLYYHSFQHVNDVLQASVMYAEMEDVSGSDLVLLKTAVLFHDSGFTVQSRDHEEIGCRITEAALPQFGYTAGDIRAINGMIMATRIPQSPQNLLEEIIADADLDYLGRDDFWEIGSMLFKELQLYGLLNDERDWNRLQIKFLQNHHYFTKSAIKLRQGKKDIHTQKVKEIVSSYKD